MAIVLPPYLQLGVEWFYLIPLLFLIHTCIRLMISKCMWQFICNTMQINNSLNSKFSYFSTWSWAWNASCIQIFSGHYIWYFKSPPNAWKSSFILKPSIQVVNRSSLRDLDTEQSTEIWNLRWSPISCVNPSIYAAVVRVVHIQRNSILCK